MSKINTNVDRRGTYSTQWDYIQDRFGKEGILPFSISDMDIAVSDEILTAIKDRIQHPVLGYSRWKHSDFRSSITQWYSRKFETEICDDWIYYSPSVMYSISKLIEILTDENDGVLILTPAYNAFFEVIENNKRKLITSSLTKNYSINFEDLENKAQKSKLILLCNPHNPVGTVFSEEELLRIIDIAQKYDLWIISDDIHMDITYETKTTPILKLKSYTDRIIIVSSISKSFNVPALTGSYAIIPNVKIQEDFENITRYRDFVNSPSVLNIIATITAYTECDEWLDDLILHLKSNRDYIVEYLNEHIPKITMIPPQGTYLGWLDYSKLQIESTVFQHHLINEGKVGIMDGLTYGVEGDQFLRINFACSREKLTEGLDRLKSTVDYLKV